MTYHSLVNFLDKSIAARATEWGKWFVLKVPQGTFVSDTLAQAFADEKNGARQPLLSAFGSPAEASAEGGGYPCDTEFNPQPPRAA